MLERKEPAQTDWTGSHRALDRGENWVTQTVALRAENVVIADDSSCGAKSSSLNEEEPYYNIYWKIAIFVLRTQIARGNFLRCDNKRDNNRRYRRCLLTQMSETKSRDHKCLRHVC